MSAPWEVARDLRWRVARDSLSDPFTWVGVAAVAWAAHRVGGASAAHLTPSGAVLVAVGLGRGAALTLVDSLLFARAENDFLRTWPLGPTGLLRVRVEEAGWWLRPLWVVLATFAHAVAGWPGVAGLVLPALGVPGLAATMDLLARAAGRSAGRSAAVIALGGIALAGLVPARPPWAALGPWWPTAVGAVAGLAAMALGRPRDRLFTAHHAAAASRAATAPPPPSRLPSRLLRLLPLPPAWRARLLRDALLLLRGQDLQSALLLMAAPLSALLLADSLAAAHGQAVTWRTLEATAMGAAAIAWATGPTAHVLRSATMAWERGAPAPGRRHTWAALAWAAAPAVAHGALMLAVVATVQGGHHADQVPALTLPVIGLELVLVHYSVAFSLNNTAGRRVGGLPSLVLSLPFVAAGVALLALVAPWAIPVWFVATARWTARGFARYDSLEVTW